MKENRTVKLLEDPFSGLSGAIWNRLHSEREDICEALLKDTGSHFKERQALLQTRLRRVDDALDRLMSGSYGNCSQCGSAIEDTRLDIDPALALCLDCWSREPRASGKPRTSQPQAPSSLQKLPQMNFERSHSAEAF